MSSTKGVTQAKAQVADAVLLANSHLAESQPSLLTSREVSAGQALLKWSRGVLHCNVCLLSNTSGDPRT